MRDDFSVRSAARPGSATGGGSQREAEEPTRRAAKELDKTFCPILLEDLAEQAKSLAMRQGNVMI
jgi:hypothetical protein